MNSLVMYRGNDGQDIYLNDADRNLLLETISEMSERFEVDICIDVRSERAQIIK